MTEGNGLLSFEHAQGKTREKLLESLRIGAEDILDTPVETGDEEELVRMEV